MQIEQVLQIVVAALFIALILGHVCSGRTTV